MLIVFLILAAVIIFYLNILMYQFCIQKEIPEEKHHTIIHTTNISTIILLVSSYVAMLFT